MYPPDPLPPLRNLFSQLHCVKTANSGPKIKGGWRGSDHFFQTITAHTVPVKVENYDGVFTFLPFLCRSEIHRPTPPHLL